MEDDAHTTHGCTPPKRLYPFANCRAQNRSQMIHFEVFVSFPSKNNDIGGSQMIPPHSVAVGHFIALQRFRRRLTPRLRSYRQCHYETDLPLFSYDSVTLEAVNHDEAAGALTPETAYEAQ